MKFVERLFINCARVIPKGYRKNFQQLMVYAGMKKQADAIIGKATLFGALLSVIVFQFSKAAYGRYRVEFIMGAVVVFILAQFLAYILVYFKAEERTKAVEAALPDTFQIMSINLRSGMTPFKALNLSHKKELGPLQDEIGYAMSKALGTGSFTNALLSISKRIRSDILDRSFKLFTTAMRGGGNLSILLEELASDISETRALKNELRTSTKTYTAFIMFTIIVGTPLLLAISVNFVEMISGIQAKSAVQTEDFGMGFLVSEVTLTPEFLTKMSMIIIVITSVLASMLMGVINEGKAKSGLKLFPTMIIGCLVVFFVASYFVGNFIVGFG